MILGVSSYITSAGLKAITSAGALGPYFAIKYFLPIYDYRIDKTICRGTSGQTSAMSISGLNLVSATDSNLFGEKIYYNGNYTLTSGNSVVYYDPNITGIVQGGTSNLLGSRQSISTNANYISTLGPVSPIISGTAVSATTPGSFYVANTNSVASAAFNPTSASNPPISAYYKVQSYSPNKNGITSATAATGSFKCRVPASGNGTFKFNGLALYGTKVNEFGFDDNGLGVSNFNFKPTLVAVILFDQAQYKQDGVGGVNDFEISVDLGFDWSTYNTSGASPVFVETNFWTKMPTTTTTSAYGLTYDGDISVASSAVPSSWTPRAKMTITDNTKQQMRLAFDNERFADFYVKRYSVSGGTPEYNVKDKSVLSVDTSCPTDALLEVGCGTKSYGTKTVAIGCYSSATGYLSQNGGASGVENSSDVLESGGYTFSMGVGTYAGGFVSWAIGDNTSAIGRGNFAGGRNSISTFKDNFDASHVGSPYSQDDCNFAYGYSTSAITRDINDYSTSYNANDSDYTTIGSSYRGGNVAFGCYTLANGGGSLAFGFKTFSTGLGSLAGGARTSAYGDGSIALGFNSNSYSNFSLAIGCDSIAGDVNYKDDSYGKGRTSYALAFGEFVSATSWHSIAIGRYAVASEVGAIAIGGVIGDSHITTVATGKEAIAIGTGAISQGYGSLAIGSYTGSKSVTAAGDKSIAIGTGVLANKYHAYAFGESVTAAGNNTMVFGRNVIAAYDNSYVFGDSITANAYSTYILGSNINVTYSGGGSVGIGNYLKLNGGSSTLVGNYLSANATNAYAFGDTSFVNGSKSISLGTGNKIRMPNSVALGTNLTVGSSDVIGTSGVISIGNGRTIDNTVSSNSIFIGSTDANLIQGNAKKIVLGGTTTDRIVLDSKYISITGQMDQIPKYDISVTTCYDTGSNQDTFVVNVNMFDNTSESWFNVSKYAANGQGYSGNSLVNCEVKLPASFSYLGNRTYVWLEKNSGKMLITNYETLTSSDMNDGEYWYTICAIVHASLTDNTVYAYDFTKMLYVEFSRNSQPSNKGGDGSINVVNNGHMNSKDNTSTPFLSELVQVTALVKTRLNTDTNQSANHFLVNGRDILRVDGWRDGVVRSVVGPGGWAG